MTACEYVPSASGAHCARTRPSTQPALHRDAPRCAAMRRVVLCYRLHVDERVEPARAVLAAQVLDPPAARRHGQGRGGAGRRRAAAHRPTKASKGGCSDTPARPGVASGGRLRPAPVSESAMAHGQRRRLLRAALRGERVELL
jgi:hypothetical protein